MINEGWALACEIGFWGWILSVVGLIIHSFTRKNHINKRSALIWGSGTVVCYASWVFGMIKAS